MLFRSRPAPSMRIFTRSTAMRQWPTLTTMLPLCTNAPAISIVHCSTYANIASSSHKRESQLARLPTEAEGWRFTPLGLPAKVERNPLATQTKKQWPTWMIVVAVLILLPPLVWALSITFNIVAAMSIGGILLVVAIVVLFIKVKGRVDEVR